MLKKLDSIICWPLVLVLLGFCLISCVTLNLGYDYYATKAGASTMWLKQGLFFGAGGMIMAFIYKFGSDRLYTGVKVLYWILMVFLILLVIERFAVTRFGMHIVPLANTVGGATSWFTVPLISSFQPSEFMKIIMVIYMAKTIEQHNSVYLEHDFHNDALLVGKVMAIALPPSILVYLQNDAGVTMIMLASVVFILFASGIKRNWYIAGLSIAGIIILFMTYLFIFQHDTFTSIISGHQLDRFYGWLDPEGTYRQQGFQLFNAEMAYGTAGLFGHGFNEVIISLQEPQTDFIFALITVGFGFIGGTIVLVLILVFDYIILNTGLRANAGRDKYFVSGIFGLLIFQQFWNIGMILGVLPITGITLPLLSYGGSSLLSYMIALGVIMDIHKQTYVLAGKNRYN